MNQKIQKNRPSSLNNLLFNCDSSLKYHTEYNSNDGKYAPIPSISVFQPLFDACRLGWIGIDDPGIK
jgi:hypothetical protein